MQKDGRYQLAGNTRDVPIVSTRVERITSLFDAEHFDRKIKEGKNHNPVEDLKVTVEDLRRKTSDSSMFDKTAVNVTVVVDNSKEDRTIARKKTTDAENICEEGRPDEEEKKTVWKKAIKAGDAENSPHSPGKMSRESGKMSRGMRCTGERKTASYSQLDALQDQLRSPRVTKVMKRGRGTPSKCRNVLNLKKIFETDASLTRGGAELLQQHNFNLLNPRTSSTEIVQSRVDSEVCVIQSRGGTQTRPRDRGDLGQQARCDWPRLPLKPEGGPTRRGVSGAEGGESKK